MIPNTYDMQREINALRREIQALQVRTGRIPTRIGRGGGTGSMRLVKAADYTALAALTTTAPAIGYTEDLGNFYGKDSAGWRVLHPFNSVAEPSGIGERDGDLWEHTDRLYTLLGGAWKMLQHEDIVWVDNGKLYYNDGDSNEQVSHYE